MQVLDAFRPRRATWSGQVTSSPPGPSGGPFMTHLLPGGGVLRVHGARRPVPPRLPHFSTSRSVHRLAAVGAGAYLPCRPPNAWSPGGPAPAGPCYWLGASGTPVGWRGGCLASGQVRGAVRHYCLGGCSALVVCAWHRQPVSDGLGPVLGAVSSRFPPSRPAFPALCVAGRPVRVSLILARWYAIPCGLCVPWARSGCPSGIPRVSFVCVCLALSRPPPPPPSPVGVARAPGAVPVLGAGTAVPHRPCPSACPASVSVWLAWGGHDPVPFPPYLVLGCALPVGWVCASGAFERRGVGVGGAACAPSSPSARPGGPMGRGVALPGSVPLPSLGRNQSGCLWRHSGHGGRGPHTAPVCARLLTPGAVRVASLCAATGSLVLRGSCGSRRLGAWRRALLRPPPPGHGGPSGGRGDRPPCLGGGGGPAPPWPPGQWGGVGRQGRGGSRRGSPPPFPDHLSRRGILPRCTRLGGVAGHLRVLGAACRRRVSLAAGGGGADCVPPSPEERLAGLAGLGVALPRSVTLASPGGRQSRFHWRRSGHGGRRPDNALVCVRVPPPGLVRVASLCAGAGSPACRSPCGSRRWGAWGRAA